MNVVEEIVCRTRVFIATFFLFFCYSENIGVEKLD